ncbi:MAG: hypothetical protein ACPL1F_01405 [bacterium]
MINGKIILIDYLNFEYFREDILLLKIYRIKFDLLKPILTSNKVGSILRDKELEKYLKDRYNLEIEEIKNFYRLYPQDAFLYFYKHSNSYSYFLSNYNYFLIQI